MHNNENLYNSSDIASYYSTAIPFDTIYSKEALFKEGCLRAHLGLNDLKRL